MPRQLKTTDSIANQTQRKSVSSSENEKDTLSLNSYIAVNAHKEWKNFLSLIHK